MAAQIREAQPRIYTPGAFGATGAPTTPTVPVHEKPPTKLLFFRFPPGVAARQIQQGSWPCRRIVFFAPGAGADAVNALSIYIGTQGVSIGGPSSVEVPPGAAGTVNIDDVIDLYFVAQNATDIITGWAESDWPGNYPGVVTTK